MRCKLLYYKGIFRKNNGRELGIAKDVQKVCGVNKHISKVGEGVCQTR